MPACLSFWGEFNSYISTIPQQHADILETSPPGPSFSELCLCRPYLARQSEIRWIHKSRKDGMENLPLNTLSDSSPAAVQVVRSGINFDGESRSLGSVRSSLNSIQRNCGLFILENKFHARGGPARLCITTRMNGSTFWKVI